MSLRDDIVARARSVAGQWYYTNDEWARLNPEQSGGSDCSGFMRWLFAQFGYNIGVWTGDESKAGRVVARGHYPSELPWDTMKPGQMIFMTATYWNDYSFEHYLCHVELYCGGGTMIGHPGGYGPTEKLAQAWMQVYKCITWMVVDVLDEEDDMDASTFWSYKNKDMNGEKDAYQLLSDIHFQLTRTDAAGWPNPEGHDFFGREQYIQMTVKAIVEKLEGLQLGGGIVDYAKLAEEIAPAVADEIYKRMKA